MPPKFAAFESRLKQAVFKHISNVETTLAGVAIQGIFDNEYALADVGGAGMASSQPRLTLATDGIPAHVVDWFLYFPDPFNALDLLMTINGTTYNAVAHEPNGTGISVLWLEVAA